MRKVTVKKANEVLAAVKALFPEQEDEFTLYPAEHEEMPKGAWSISAEGVWDINDCWPVAVLEVAHSVRNVPGHLFNQVFLEPLASWSLGIYPVED